MPVAVRHFETAEGMIEHYKAVHARLFAKRPDPAIVQDPPRMVFPDPPPRKYRDPAQHTVFRPVPGVVGARAIVDFIAAKHLTYGYMVMGRFRDANVIEARHDAIAMIHKVNPKWTLHRIAQFIGRDHTSILHALKKHGGYTKPGGV